MKNMSDEEMQKTDEEMQNKVEEASLRVKLASVWCTSYLIYYDDPKWYFSLAYFIYLITLAFPLALIMLLCGCCLGVISLCVKKLRSTAQIFLLQACIPAMCIEGIIKGAPFCPIVPFCLPCAFGETSVC